MTIYSIVRRSLSVILGVVVQVVVTYSLQRHLPGFAVPSSSYDGLTLTIIYFFLGGIFGGIVSKRINGRAGILDGITIGTPLPLLLLFASRIVHETIPVMILVILASAAYSGAIAGILLSHRQMREPLSQ